MTIINDNIFVRSATTPVVHKGSGRTFRNVGQSPSNARFGGILTALSGHPRNAKAGNLPDIISQMMAAAQPSRKADAELALNSGSIATPHLAKKLADPMIALEGSLMGRFVDEMLPKGKDSIYGGGLAGDTWRGYAGEQMANTLAQSDPLNLSISPFASTTSGGELSLFGKANNDGNSSEKITPFAIKV